MSTCKLHRTTREYISVGNAVEVPLGAAPRMIVRQQNRCASWAAMVQEVGAHAWFGRAHPQVDLEGDQAAGQPGPVGEVVAHQQVVAEHHMPIWRL